jgi:hypothetical protein
MVGGCIGLCSGGVEVFHYLLDAIAVGRECVFAGGTRRNNEFAARGVVTGDRLYIVHYEGREVFLGARLVIGRTLTKAEAAAALGISVEEIWDARDHVLAEPEAVERLDPDRLVAREVPNQLTFVRSDGVALKRGSCLGPCPVYEFEFWRDGTAKWHGEYFIDRVGLHVGEIQSSQVPEGVELAISVGFFGLADVYPPPGTDLPDHTIQLATGLRDKTIQTWGGVGPAEFETLADRLDAMAETVQWEGVRDEP